MAGDEASGTLKGSQFFQWLLMLPAWLVASLVGLIRKPYIIGAAILVVLDLLGIALLKGVLHDICSVYALANLHARPESVGVVCVRLPVDACERASGFPVRKGDDLRRFLWGYDGLTDSGGKVDCCHAAER
jgi:hypothetical protein